MRSGKDSLAEGFDMHAHRWRLFSLGLTLAWAMAGPLLSKEISGPQVGDKITPFVTRGTLDDERGKELDLVKQAGDKTLVLYFLHDRSRPAVALAREVLSTAADLRSQGVTAGLVILSPDVAATEEWVNIARNVFPRGVPVSVSPDGPQGPPAYNLSSKVVATVIVAQDNRVVANFAFTQPTPDDAGPIVEAIKSAAQPKK
jgi:hypothetical protein